MGGFGWRCGARVCASVDRAAGLVWGVAARRPVGAREGRRWGAGNGQLGRRRVGWGVGGRAAVHRVQEHIARLRARRLGVRYRSVAWRRVRIGGRAVDADAQKDVHGQR